MISYFLVLHIHSHQQSFVQLLIPQYNHSFLHAYSLEIQIVHGFIKKNLPSTSFMHTSRTYSQNAAQGIANTDPASNTFRPKSGRGFVGLAKSLADQVSLRRLPCPEPSVINGDPLTYFG